MARAGRKRKAVDAWKEKRWYDILAPKVFNEVKIGETVASSPQAIIGRVIETTMRDISGDFSKQHIKLRFQIEDVRNNKAHTRFKGQSLSRDYMRSQIRRKTTRVEGVTTVVTKDGHTLRTKSIALAVGRAQTAQERLIRKIMVEKVKEAARNQTLDEFLQDVALGKLPMALYKAANKIYPLKRVEIRKITVMEGTARAASPPPSESEEESSAAEGKPRRSEEESPSPPEEA
jgi:small subunit ribosomal protein S3Ae